MKLDVIKLDGEKAGSVELDADLFGLEPRTDILHRMVRWQRNNAQAGTHKVKTRSETSYSTKKIYRQKGTGGQDSAASAGFVGGGCDAAGAGAAGASGSGATGRTSQPTTAAADSARSAGMLPSKRARSARPTAALMTARAPAHACEKQRR